MTGDLSEAELVARLRSVGIEPEYVSMSAVSALVGQVLAGLDDVRRRFGDVDPPAGGFDD